MVDYVQLRKTADRLIRKFGRPNADYPELCYLRSFTGTGNRWEPSQSTVDTPIQVVVIDYTVSERQNTTIQQADQRALVSAEGLAVTPDTAYQLVVGTEPPYEVVTIKPLNPGGAVLLYDAQVRR